MDCIVEKRIEDLAPPKKQGEGDNLVMAREFVNMGSHLLTQLMSEPRLDPDQIATQVSQLSDKAAQISAWAIHRAAFRVTELLQAQAPQPRIDGQLTRLFHLHKHYKAGLDAVMPISVLESISHEDQSELDISQTKPIKRRIALDMIMPALDDTILFAARKSGKLVCVSHIVGTCSVGYVQIRQLAYWLQILGMTLVQYSVETAEQRQMQGFARHSQISVTAKQEIKERVNLTVSCQGLDLPGYALIELREIARAWGVNHIEFTYDKLGRTAYVNFTHFYARESDQHGLDEHTHISTCNSLEPDYIDDVDQDRAREITL